MNRVVSSLAVAVVDRRELGDFFWLGWIFYGALVAFGHVIGVVTARLTSVRAAP